MRWTRWSWSEKALFLTPLLFVGIAWFGFLKPDNRVFRPDILQKRIDEANPLRGRESGGPVRCPSNLRQIALAILQYSQDADSKLPLVTTGGTYYGWADALQPYVKSTQVFQCPKQKGFAALPTMSGYTDYYLNSQVAGRSKDLIDDESIYLLGEGNDGHDLADGRYSRNSFAVEWWDDEASPLYRHLTDQVWASRGSYIAFLDGHVKWFEVKTLRLEAEASDHFNPRKP